MTILLKASKRLYTTTPEEPVSSVLGKTGWVEDGAYAGQRKSATDPLSAFNPSSLRLPPAWAIDSGMRECVLNIGLWELINVSTSGTTYKAGSIETKIAPLVAWNNTHPTQQLRVSLRVHVGDRAPNYWKTTCGYVTVTDANFGKKGWVPRWWVPTYRTLYSDAWAALAPIVDAMDEVATINAPGCAYFYPEPQLRFPGSTVSTGVTVGDNLIAAGYTQALDKSWNLWFPSAHSVFKKTVVEVALNPAPFVSATGGSTAVDEQHYKDIGNALISAMPQGHAQLANYSAREEHMINVNAYHRMYDWFTTKRLEAWVGVQLARPHRVAYTFPDTRRMWGEVAQYHAENWRMHFVETTGPKAGSYPELDAPNGGTANIWPTAYQAHTTEMASINSALLANPRPVTV